jgi:hypothetical protein
MTRDDAEELATKWEFRPKSRRRIVAGLKTPQDFLLMGEALCELAYRTGEDHVGVCLRLISEVKK